MKSLIVQPDDDLDTLTEQTQDVHHLRRRRVLVKNVLPETKLESLTFKHFFPKLLRTFKHFDFNLNKDFFKLQINLNLDENLKKFFDETRSLSLKLSILFPKEKTKHIIAKEGSAL